VPTKGVNLLDAASQGAMEGWHISVSVIVMLIAFLSLIAMVDAGFSLLGQQLAAWGFSLDWAGLDLATLSLRQVLGSLFLLGRLGFRHSG
jgi:CNT family concentrative nucleoside transporter